MKKDKIIYWVATVVAAGMGIMAGAMYFANPMVAEGFKHLGYPDYFRVELGIGKLVGGIILVIPMAPPRLKEWVYTGFGITYISAMIAHSVVEGPAKAIWPLVVLSILIVSYVYFHKTKKLSKMTA